MNRNHKLLFTFFVALVVALMGCGDSDEPDYTDPQIDSGDSGTDANEQDSYTDTDTKDSAPDQIQSDTNNDSEVDSGKDVTTDSVEDNIINEDVIPDSDADTDTLPTEICDGVDNNGDGIIDEGFECKLGDSFQCQTACGSVGTVVCQAGCVWGDCIPPTETCDNGVDDDCDGKIDCADPDCSSKIHCQPELCDGVDNNGNGIIDEGFECKLGTTNLCQTTCGSIGMVTCTADCSWSACQPPVENCHNGVDDDCDGKIDCADPDCANFPSCICDPPKIGDDCMIAGEFFDCDPSIRCNCSFLWDYTATGNFSCVNQEICNGFDDNGNGQIDEGFECIKGSAPVACTTSCGSTGTKPCLADCSYGACQPPVENCSNGIDDDCDGKVDCADPDCASMLHCQSEVCDGVDNNGNGQIDEGFACIKGSAPVACATSCGSTGTKPCLADCSYGACQPPVENCSNGIDDDCDGKVDCADPDCFADPFCVIPENCSNGIDDDGDNLVDCDDPDCATDVACHDFGDCPVQNPTGVPYTCGTWDQDVVPSSIFLIRGGCANSEFDQWAIGGNYTDVKAIRLTGNHTWTEVTLPVQGKSYIGSRDVICLGQNNVFLLYNNEDEGVILHWNGSSLIRLLPTQLIGINIIGLAGTGVNDLWFTGYGNETHYPTAYLYKWNGTSLTQHELPVAQGKVFRAQKFFKAGEDDLYLAGMEFDPNDYYNPDTHTSMLLHWDGKSWAKVPGSESLIQFTSVHGSSSCDLMAVGGKLTANGSMGASLHRNGNQWITQIYTNLDFVKSVVKISPDKFVLQGHESDGGHGYLWTGTSKGDGSVLWSRNYKFLSEGADFWHGGATWKIPNSNIIMQAGDGIHGTSDPSGSGTYAHILRSTCQ